MISGFFGKRLFAVTLLLTSSVGYIYAQKPNATMVVAESVQNAGSAKEIDSLFAIYRRLQATLPEADHPGYSNSFNFIRGRIAIALLQENSPSGIAYIDSIGEGHARRTFMKTIVALLKENGKEKLAENILQKELDLFRNKSSKEEKESYGTYAALYAGLLNELNRDKEALSLFKEAFATGQSLSTEHQISYAALLMDNGEPETALEFLKDITARGYAVNTQKVQLKKAYLQSGRKPQDYTAFYAGLTENLFKKTVAELSHRMVNYPAPDFTLTDLNGEKVSLASLRGKLVFIDFWATWCGPCVGSFPAMQKAVDKYKNDPDIVFLFINSWERENDPDKRIKNVSDLIKEKGYSFRILLDIKTGNDYTVIKQYNVKGIPAKFIIDKKGQVRYALSGFNGGIDATVAEIDHMIDDLRKR